MITKTSKLIINSLLTLCFLWLSGCTAAVDSTAALPADNKEGLVAFSVVCTGYSRMQMVYDYKVKNFFDMSNYSLVRNNYISFACNKPYPQYQVFKLGSGQYYFFGIQASKYTPDDISTGRDFQPIDFEVIPGKVVYLGRFYIAAQEGERKFFSDKIGKFFFAVNNKAHEDIPWLLNNYRNIPQSAYVVNIVNIKK